MAQKLFMLSCVFVIKGAAYSDPVINECFDRTKYITEDTAATFICRNYGTWVSWYLYDGADNRIGGCNNLNCDSEDSFSIQAWKIKNGDYESQLDIRNVTRQHVFTLFCYVSHTKQDSCSLQVIAPALVPSETCHVELSNWKVHGTCLVFRMYASNNNYSCAWHQSDDVSYSYGGFAGTLKSYTESNSRGYKRGNCSFTQEMPIVRGNYTYSLRVFPGSGVYYNDTVSISYPNEQKPAHNCPELILEGSDLNCTCKSTALWSPPAKLVWDGLLNETLKLSSLSRQSTGNHYICRLVWGPGGYINISTTYIITIAYGPSAVLVNSTPENGSETIRFTCTAIDVYPSVMFTWNINCHDQTDNNNTSTCILNLAKQDEQLLVTCTARNTHFQSVLMSQTIVQPVVRDEVVDTAASTESISGGVIGGAIAAAVIVLVIVAVVVCIIKRRKGSPTFMTNGGSFFHINIPLSKLYAVVKKPKTQTPIERHSAPSGDLYTVPRSATAQQGEDEYASVYEAADNNGLQEESYCNHQADEVAERTNKWTATAKSTVKPAVVNNKFRDISDVYVNVTEVPTDSGLGVYHVVPSASLSGTMSPDSSTLATSEEEYNALHFEEDRAGQDDAAADYNHLQITQSDYFILERA